MIGRRWRLSAEADADADAILRESRHRFGPDQMVRYADLITRGADMAGQEPMRAGSMARDDIAQGLRSLHLALAAGRRGAAVHVLYYLMRHDNEGILIARILHERMDPARHLTSQ